VKQLFRSLSKRNSPDLDAAAHSIESGFKSLVGSGSMSTKKPPDPLDPVLQPPGEGIADSVYEAIGMLLRGLLYHEHSGGRTPEHLAGQVRRSIAILSPAIAAEI